MRRFDDIDSDRLTMRLMPKAALRALAKRDIARAAASIAAEPDEGLRELDSLAAMRLRQLARDPAYLPWSLRAIMLKDSRALVGYCNFHAGPGDEALNGHGKGAVEMGYTVFAAHRRKGYALETVRTMMAWAKPRGGKSLILSISPDNTPSLRLAKKLKARKVGEHVDEEDGLEYVFAVKGL